MDPQYAQTMIQQLMQPGANPMATGQNASTPYGQSFMTGGQAMPGDQNNMGMLNNQAPGSQQLQQPMATYGGGY